MDGHEDLRTARVLLDMLGPETLKAEAVLMRIAARVQAYDAGLALALTAQARLLRLAADESGKLVQHLLART